MGTPSVGMLAGLLQGGSPAAPVTRLDVATLLDTDPFIDVDVLANDPIQGTLSSPVVSGPGTPSIQANQIRFIPNGAGVSVITYNSTVGALTDVGTLTVVTTSVTGGGSPPAVGATFQNTSTAGSGVPTIVFGITTPANTRVLLFSLSTWLDFGPAEPQTITLTVTYDGVTMTRVDTFGDQAFRGDSSVPTDTGPAVYTFALQTPTDVIAAAGDISYTTTMAAGGPEIRAVSVIPITHPTADLTLAELGITRFNGGAVDAEQLATAPSNAVAVNYCSIKRDPAVTGDAGWTQEELAEANGTTAATSGRHLAETLLFTPGGNAAHTATFDAAVLRGTATYAVSDDTGGGGVAPTGQALTANAATSGPDVLVDVIAGSGASPAATITGIDLISGGGTAIIDGDDVRFTPPASADTSVVEVSIANTAGAIIDTVTFSTAAFATGPKVGDGVGLGISGTTALTATVNALVNGTVRPNLVTLNDRGMTDVQIRAANPGFVDLTGTTGAALNAAIAGGDTQLFLTNQVYNWSDLGDNQTTPVGGLEIVGLAGNDVIIGGTAKNVGQRRRLIRGDLRVEGVNFRDGAVAYSAIGLAATVASVSITHCTADNMGALLHHELPTPVSDNLVITDLVFSKNIITDVRDGMNMRMGIGGGNPMGSIVTATIEDNIVDGWTRYALAIHYDNPPTGLVYNEANTFGAWRRNLVQNSTTMDGNGFALSSGAFEDHIFEENWGANNSRGGSGFDAEFMYTKSRIGIWRNNVVWNSGQNDFQGMVGGKGEPGLSGDVLGELLIEYNMFGSDQGDTDNLIWFQRSNMNVRSNTIIVGSDSRVAAGQSSSPYQNGQFFDNLIRLAGTATNNGFQVFGDWDGFT